MGSSKTSDSGPCPRKDTNMSNSKYLTILLIVSLIVAGVLYSEGKSKGTTDQEKNCVPGEKVVLYPLTPGFDSNSDSINITVNRAGLGQPSVRTYLDLLHDRFTDTDGDAYLVTYRNQKNIYCYTIFATPTGQRTDYLWMSDQVLSLMGLATPIP